MTRTRPCAVSLGGPTIRCYMWQCTPPDALDTADKADKASEGDGGGGATKFGKSRTFGRRRVNLGETRSKLVLSLLRPPPNLGFLTNKRHIRTFLLAFSCIGKSRNICGSPKHRLLSIVVRLSGIVEANQAVRSRLFASMSTSGNEVPVRVVATVVITSVGANERASLIQRLGRRRTRCAPASRLIYHIKSRVSPACSYI